MGGVGFHTGSQKGRTNGNGAFDYIEGETVALSLGELQLGTAIAQHKVTLLDLVGTDNLNDTRVVNMARLLQSLDEDGDPQKGISITEPIISCLEMSMQELEIDQVDFNDEDEVLNLIINTLNHCSDIGIDLELVSLEEALENLEKGLTSEVFRKNISKTPEMETAKAKLELLPVYVPAQRANGEPVQLIYRDADGVEKETRTEAKPLVSVYADEIPGTDGAMDVFGAVSRDEGNTWKVTNLSRSADKSSFKLENGYDFPGDVLKPNIKVSGNKILAVWTSRYAKSGKPTYAISLDDDYIYDDEYYEEDIWGVGGPQRSTDYTDMDFPEVGELPYHCVWTCRGVISTETGEITWFKPERLTSGRRDAYQIMVNAANNAGFALVWQEDPEGVRPGEMAGPGHGWSGATTNHKTDVWYSYVKWNDFDLIDENFESGGDPQHDEDKELTGRPKALVPFKLPVRISDNDTLNSDSMKLVVDENGPIWDEESDNWLVDPTLESGKDGKGSGSGQTENDTMDGLNQGDSDNGKSGKDGETGDSLGSHAYGLEVPGLCDSFFLKINNQGQEKWVAVTSDGRLMDGDTGASRPNIMLQPYMKPDGTYDAWVAVVYEETKGVGSGPPTDVVEDDTTVLSGDKAKENDGSGEKKGLTEYVPDEGKNVIYHSFTLTKPELVSAGAILNPQATDEEGNLLYLEDEEGNPILDWKEDLIPAYENARRPRLLIQSKKNALDAVGSGEEATVMVTVFKMGEEGKGRPSDIFMRRWTVVKDLNAPSNKGNPYRPENLDEECQNISSVTPTDTWENPESESQGREPIKVVQWDQTEENLEDQSWTNPYDDARAHRGFIKGNFLAIAYDWTPNWAAARNGNDIFNLYIRRSFDGGTTWTTDPDGDGTTHTNTFKIYTDEEGTLDLMASEDGSGKGDGSGQKESVTEEIYYGPGEFEPARNMSQITNTKETVIEPRLVGVPGTTLTDGEAKYPQDVQAINAFWITYGTHSNPGRNSEEEGVPLDLYYSYSTDFGDNFYTITKEIQSEKSNNSGEIVEIWDWLAKDSGKKESEQAECQIRMTPDGSVFYAVWNETGEEGSDVWFRRIMRDGVSIEAVETSSDITDPIITISGISDGDTTNEDVTIDISLNEEGTWTSYLSMDDQYFDEFDEDDVPYIIYADGKEHSYLLRVEAEDTAGNISSKDISFTIDGRVPIITIEGVTNGEITNLDKTVNITATGDITTISMNKDEEEIEFASGDTLSEDGVYRISVTSTNKDDNLTSTKTLDFIIDKFPPEINVKGFMNKGSYSKELTPTIEVTDNHGTEESIIVEAELNDSNYKLGTAISDSGEYTLVISAEDEAGNKITEIFEFSIDIDNQGNSGGSGSGGSPRDNSSKDGQKPQDSSSNLTESIRHDQTTEITTEDNKLRLSIPSSATVGDSTITITSVEENIELTKDIFKIGNMIYSIDVKDQNGDKITHLNKDMVLEFYYDDEYIPEGVNEGEFKICYWDKENQMWIAIPTKIDTEANKVTGKTDYLTMYGVMLMIDFPTLEDVKGHWAEKEVYRIVSMKIASGDIDGKLRPEDKITREEFAKLIILAAGLEPEINPVLTFEDSDSIAPWARGYVAAAVNAGIIQGYENNTFMPQQYISRVEIATVAVKALNMELPEQTYVNFNDINDIPKWGVPYVAKAVAEGIVTGFSDGTFKSNSNATRAQAIVLISRMIDVKKD